ncbi:Uncharacterised protein [Mycobacteroides abscessus subsp. abscessus]|nr:Uncharacterised protein [Mycobacteroides abscessus subsp. abscessus]
MASTPSAFGMPEAVTAGNSASSASIRVMPALSSPLTVDPRC